MADVVTTLRATTTNSSLVRASNVVTVTMSAATTNVKVGDTVVISGSTATTDDFNGTFTVTEVTSTTVYKYAQTGTDETATAAGSTGGNYSSLSTWESTEQTDLTASGDKHILECYNDWPSGLNNQITINGWTTSSAYFITVTTATGHGHNGIVNNGFTVAGSYPSANLLLANQPFTVFRGFTCSNTGSGGIGCSIGTDCTADKMIAVNCVTYCFSSFGTGSGKLFRNCLAVTTNIGFINNGTTDYENCTAVDTVTGFLASAGTTLFSNCVAISSSSCWIGTPSASSTNNASSDSLAPGTAPITGITTADFVDYANDNYRPVDTQDLWGAGAVLSGTFTDDIRGETRSVWSIGAFDTDYILRTLKSTGGDYSNVETWNSTEQVDLAATGDKHILEISSGTFDTASAGLWLGGWDASSSYYITIKAAAGDEWSATLRSTGTLNNDVALNMKTVGYTRVQDITITREGSTYNYIGTAVSWGFNDGLIDGWIVERCKINGGQMAIRLSGYNTGITVPPTIRNCEIIPTVRVDMGSNDGNIEQIIFQNNTVKGEVAVSIRDVGRADNSKIQNNYAETWTYSNPGARGTVSNNASTDASAPGTSPVTGISTTTDFEDYAGGDYRPASGSNLIDAGTDLSGTFTDDIAGNTRG